MVSPLNLYQRTKRSGLCRPEEGRGTEGLCKRHLDRLQADWRVLQTGAFEASVPLIQDLARKKP